MRRRGNNLESLPGHWLGWSDNWSRSLCRDYQQRNKQDWEEGLEGSTWTFWCWDARYLITDAKMAIEYRGLEIRRKIHWRYNFRDLSLRVVVEVMCLGLTTLKNHVFGKGFKDEPWGTLAVMFRSTADSNQTSPKNRTQLSVNSRALALLFKRSMEEEEHNKKQPRRSKKK